MDSSTYRVLLNKIKRSNAIPHFNFPSHNLLSIGNLCEVSVGLSEDIPEDDTRFLSSVPFYQKFPFAIAKSCPYFCGSGVTDDAQGLVLKKSKWQKDLMNLKLHDVDKAIKQIKDLRQDKPVKLSKNLKKLVHHIDNDPEPMFFGDHNWLYSGGTLSYIEAFDGAILIGADAFDRKPGFNVLKLSESLDEIQYQKSSILKASPVLQITSKCKEDSLILCVRQKHHLNMFSITKTDCLTQPVKLWKKKVKPPKLITCADINTNCEEVLLSDSNRDVHVFHVEKKNKVYGAAGRKMFPQLGRDPWSQVAFGVLGLYVAFRNCFLILDPRDLNTNVALEYTPSHVLNNCEEICSFVRSPIDPNYVYLGTTHSVLELDIRSGETVQKWTHLMKKPPQFLATTKDGHQKEILLLHSQVAGEMLGIMNEALQDGDDKTSFISKSLPCLLSGVAESLEEVRRHGVCLNPHLTKRINFSITGMQCVKSSAGHRIFTNNSGGDIFLSKLQRTEDIPVEREEDEQTMESMKMYESHLKNFTMKETLNPHLKVIDMSHVLKDLTHLEQQPENPPKKGKFCWRWHEMYSPDNAEFYQDYIADKILRVWGYAPPEEDTGDASIVDDKVIEWMWKYC